MKKMDTNMRVTSGRGTRRASAFIDAIRRMLTGVQQPQLQVIPEQFSRVTEKFDVVRRPGSEK